MLYNHLDDWYSIVGDSLVLMKPLLQRLCREDWKLPFFIVCNRLVQCHPDDNAHIGGLVWKKYSKSVLTTDLFLRRVFWSEFEKPTEHQPLMFLWCFLGWLWCLIFYLITFFVASLFRTDFYIWIIHLLVYFKRFIWLHHVERMNSPWDLQDWSV